MAHYRKRLITFVMSEDCNMACRYCYSSENMNKAPRSLSLDFAYSAFDDFFLSGINSIRFFGVGEATMQPENIEKIFNYVSQKFGTKPYTEVQTNGTFSHSTCEMLCNIADMVWFSCDGTPDIQDYHRPLKNGLKSSVVLERNISNFNTSGKQFGIRATISGVNLHRQKEMIDYFIELGAKCAFADLICLPIMQGNGEYKVNGNDYVQSFIEAKNYAESKGFFYSNFYMVNFDESTNIPCRCNIPMPHIMPSGYVSACDMVTDITGTLLDNLLYGKYDNDRKTIFYDDEKIALIRGRTVDKLPACMNCSIKYFCAGGCVGEAINETNDLYGVKEYLCHVTKALAEKLGYNYVDSFPYLHP